jgi:hypothetical protein
MNYKFLCGWLLVAAGSAACLPLQAGPAMSPEEDRAYKETWGEAPAKDLGDMKAPRANAVSSAWRVGLEALLSTPRQDFRDMTGRSGFGGAFFLENELSDSWRVQTRFEYIRYPQTDQSFIGDLVPGNGPIKPLTLTATAASIGADVHYHLPYPGWHSLYLLGGVRAMRYELRYTTAAVRLDPLAPAGVIQTSKYHTPVTMGVDLGFGVDFNRTLAMSTRYTYTSVSGVAFVTCDLGISARF